MPRQARIDAPGAVHHVVVRGLERKEIFLNDSDRNEFLSRLEKALNDTKCLCYAWALIPNHLHLLIRTGIKSLSTLMRKLLSGYAIYFNKTYHRSGYLFQNRYKSILCQEDKYFLELVRYIHLNPLRAGLVKSLGELDRYPWTGHSCLVGNIKRPWQNTDEVLALFDNKRNAAITSYRNFVKEAIDMGKREDLTGGGLRRSANGWKEVIKLKKEKEYWRGDERILGDGLFVERVLRHAEEQFERKEKIKREGWTLERLVCKVSDLVGVPPSELRNKRRSSQVSLGKALICYWGFNDLGISGAELGRYFGISRFAASKNIMRGEDYVRRNDLKLTS